MRRSGTSYAHPLVVLIVSRTADPVLRFGVSAGRSVGDAIRRNRAKRRIRAILAHLHPFIASGWNVIVLARGRIHSASHRDLHNALVTLCSRAGILTTPPDDLYLP
ncbi:MAG: hypothetical protein Fur0018_03180 [Anaerolineales bacterium]